MAKSMDRMTTKHPIWIRARQKLDTLSAEITLTDCAALLGVALATAQRYAQDGRYGARKVGSSGAWRFGVNDLRVEIGLLPLPEVSNWCGRAERHKPHGSSCNGFGYDAGSKV